MTEALKVAALAVLQGVAEFLPISSSGHLVIGREGMGLSEAGLRLDVFLHVGTLVAVFAFYRKVVMRMVAMREWAYALKIALSAVPVGVVGVFLRGRIEDAFSSPAAVACALLFTGLVLVATKWLGRGAKEMTWLKALSTGVAQAVAILPGVSRSGMTISAARAMGVSPARAAEFSFLMSAPPIAGAAILDIVSSGGADAAVQTPWGLVAFGGVLSAAVGYFSLKVLVRILDSDRFWLFGPYCIAAALIVFLVV